MLVNQENITLPLIILGNIAAIISGLIWIWQSNNLLAKTRQPKPKLSQSIAKVFACLSAFWTIYFIAITNWEIL